MTTEKWVTLYSHITIWAVIYGILAAHVPFIIHIPWTTCDDCTSKWQCVVLLHGFDVPMSLLNLYVAWYGLKRFRASTRAPYISLLGIVIGANFSFLCFECMYIYLGLRSGAHPWEILLLATIAFILLGSCFMAIYIKQKLVHSTGQIL